jgi:hypothetical protein
MLVKDSQDMGIHLHAGTESDFFFFFFCKGQVN